MAARKEFPVKVRRVAVTNKKTGVKYIEERRYQYDPAKGVFGYEEYNGGVKITNYTGTEDFVSVPAKINGKKVTVIDSEVFAGHSELKSITLPEGLESIGYQFIAGTGITSDQPRHPLCE